MAGLCEGPVSITVVCFCGTGFFLEILVLPAGLEGLRAAPACSRGPGDPLRNAPLWPPRARFLSLPPARADVETPGFLLSRIDLPIRRFAALLVPAEPLRSPEFLEAETDGVRLVIELPMR